MSLLGEESGELWAIFREQGERRCFHSSLSKGISQCSFGSPRQALIDSPAVVFSSFY